MGEVVEDSRHLMVAPACLRTKVLAFMEREIEQARQGRAAYLGFKLNGLTDKLIIDKLIEASRAGVKVDLMIRGICCLIGGVPGWTENIRVHSIVGRYLEHARIYLFGLGERRQVYISSADFMTRNTTRRVEVAVPIYDPALRTHLEQMFQDQFRDTAKGRVQQPDGQYLRAEGELFNAQEHFCDQAYDRSWAVSAPAKRRPAGSKTAVKPSSPKLETPKQAVSKSPPAITVRKSRRGLLGRMIGRKK